MQRVCVFCGSSPGRGSEYGRVAQLLGRALVDRGLGLVYGGASVGLMGQLARTVLAAEGEVVGVVPAALAEREVAFVDLPDLRVVGSMHERKALMAELSDAFIALPGGMGTIEELFEIVTWAQLTIHKKPCGLLNVNNYYDHLVRFLDHAVDQDFMRPIDRALVLVDQDPEQLLNRFGSFQPANLDKAEWILSVNK